MNHERQPVRLENLTAIVPAVRDAYVRIIERYVLVADAEAPESRQWMDAVYHVLAYASVRPSEWDIVTAYYVLPLDGDKYLEGEPGWFAGTDSPHVEIVHSFTEPKRGHPPASGFTDGYEYYPQGLGEYDLALVGWILD